MQAGRTLRRNWYASISLGQGQTAQGKLVKACQVPDENPGADEGLNLLGVTLVLPAIQSIELPRNYSWAEQAIAFPWAKLTSA